MADPAHESKRCPQCRAWMTAGHVSVSQGLHWMRRAEGPLGDFAETLPGTHAVLRPNRLPAWRCTACQLVLMQYGHDVHKQSTHARSGPSVGPGADPADSE